MNNFSAAAKQRSAKMTKKEKAKLITLMLKNWKFHLKEQYELIKENDRQWMDHPSYDQIAAKEALDWVNKAIRFSKEHPNKVIR